MKHFLRFHCLYILISIFSINAAICATEKIIYLKRGLANKSISLIAIGKGGVDGEYLKLNMKNNTDKTLTVVVDPALIFVPEDTIYQNLVTMGFESVELQPAQVKEISVTVFCGKSYARCPKPNLRFKYWKQGDSNFVKVMKYVHENSIQKTDMNLVQRAVWTFTNHFCLGTVYSPEHAQLSEQLVKYMASLKKATVPVYYSYSKINDHADKPAYTGENQRVSVTVKWPNNITYRSMTVKVMKENGEIYKKIESGQYIDKEGHTLVVEFSADRDPHGKYTVEVCDETNKVWDKKVVIVGEEPCKN